ncbi:MAG: nucleotidyltransferase family protein [Nitrospirota bacterium]
MNRITEKKYLTEEKIISLLEKNREILRKYKVKKIGLFGSYVKGKPKKKSDIDLLVEFEIAAFDSNYTGYFDNYEKLSFFLRKILGRRIDLLTIDMISPYIKPYISKEIEYLETS